MRRRELALAALALVFAGMTFVFWMKWTYERKYSTMDSKADRQRKDMAFQLDTLTGFVRIAEPLFERAPVEPRLFAAWVEDRVDSKLDSQGRSVDLWGNPVILVSNGKTLVALGSAGPDGIWNHGVREDVVIVLERPADEGRPIGSRPEDSSER